MWLFSIIAWVFPGVTLFFNLALPFPDSFNEMGSRTRLMWDGRIGFKAKWGGYLN